MKLRTRGEWRGHGLALMASTLISLPYLIGIQDGFASDDWVHLTYNRGIPPWQLWRYFSPNCVWFYRPLQALQFGWLYHAVGLRPLAYNLSLWVMHLAVCQLVYILASRLTAWRVALLTTALFAAQWVYADVLLWPSNFSTLQWALLTLALCIVFLRYLESRGPVLLAGVYTLFVLNFLAKETAVDAPLLLLTLWWWHRAQSEPEAPPIGLRETIEFFAPFGAITLAYLAFHRWGVHDVYRGAARPEYQFAAPGQVLGQLFTACNHLLLSFYRDPIVLPLVPGLPTALQSCVQHGYVLPLLLGAVAWRRRDWVLRVGLLWLAASLIPTILLTGFQASRFYYLPAVGSALIVARCGQWCWRRVSAPAAPLRSLRPLLPAGLAYLLLANLSLRTLLCLRIRDDSRQAAAAFRVLRQARPRLPRGPLIVLQHPPPTSYANGLGVPEMVRIALHDPSAQGVVDGEHLPDIWLQRLHRVPFVYVLNFDRRPLTLRSVSPAGSGTRHTGGCARQEGHPPATAAVPIRSTNTARRRAPAA